ncbi:MAG: FHA domain-containing protein [Myxococcota bacterium]
MARRTLREIEFADHLWDCLTRIAEDSGTDHHAVVNQAVYEFARRLNFLTPIAKEAHAPQPAVVARPAERAERAHPPERAARAEPAEPRGDRGDRVNDRARAEARPSPHGGGEVRARSAPAPQGAAPGPKVLYVVNSAGDMHKVDKDTFIIGRSRTCDLVIPSSKVSRQHGGISRENGSYYIEDLGSANGVWKNGIRIQKELIRDGDEFMISEETLKFIYR